MREGKGRSNIRMYPFRNIDCRAMFIFERIVGKGGFGRVWKVKDKKNKDIYALKVIDKARVISKKSVQSILN